MDKSEKQHVFVCLCVLGMSKHVCVHVSVNAAMEAAACDYAALIIIPPGRHA